ncbi:MAG: amidohydrolase family protein, partial [Clostridia bacterium]|nr:amidohydrolase family protein [Clostridia bacterium]
NGVNVCFGTGYASISGKQDMFKEMFLALASQNNLLGGRELSAKDILKMATTNGAKALNLENVGTLNEGYFADLIMIDVNSTNNAVQNDIFENLVTCCGVEDIVLTMVGGKIIYQKDDRIFLKSQEKVLEKNKGIQNKLK